MKFSIRPMTSNDAKRIAELSGDLGYPTTAYSVGQRIMGLEGRTDHALLVAHEASNPTQILGWVHVRINESIETETQAEIRALIVDESSRGQGLGKKLVEAAEAWSMPLVNGITLSSQTSRSEAHRFYQKLNYRISKTSYTFRKALTAAPSSSKL